MKYIADLHVHSRYSIATSKFADLEGYYQWGKIKGINIIGTGDFTHPAYFSEIREKLKPDGSGFFTLKDPPSVRQLPVEGMQCQDLDVRFCLSSEISSIYKKNSRTRKVHSLVYAPSIEVAAKIRSRLDAIGNIKSDGRPILGLDPRDLLEIILEISEEACLVPAHVWTPWFSIFGSKSGFDQIEECFEELTPRIFALETGLSSDPEMNWRWSALDRYSLISNSDAHSPAKLGREANLFDTEKSYQGMFGALKTRKGFLGTLEFYPEEGKYHLDGHRKCNVCLEPEETRRLKGLCPGCGKPLTVGVMHRVLELADRDRGARPERAAGFQYIIPLPEIISEVAGKGPATKTVLAGYAQLISLFGSEFRLLLDTPLAEIEKQAGRVYREAVHRMRSALIHPRPGYDGEFGVIKVFRPGEVAEFLGQDNLFVLGPAGKKSTRTRNRQNIVTGKVKKAAGSKKKVQLNSRQAKILDHTTGAVIISAGPGTGKTRTLTAWIEHLVTGALARPAEILAITFTNKAAREMAERLGAGTSAAARVRITTFHSLCFDLLQEYDPHINIICDHSKRIAMLDFILGNISLKEVRKLAAMLQDHFENPGPVSDTELAGIKRLYQAALTEQGAVDLSGLISGINLVFSEKAGFLKKIRSRYNFIAIDEFQDINREQYRLISSLGRDKTVLAIGDPDQGIYSFRGADPGLFFRFKDDFRARELVLSENYRSTGNVLQGAGRVIAQNSVKSGLVLHTSRPAGAEISLISAPDLEREAAYIVSEIERLVGGIHMHMADSTRELEHYSFSDIAVLFRLNSVGKSLIPFLRKAGIPAGFRDRQPLLEREPYCLVNSIICCLLNENDLLAMQDCLLTTCPGSTREIKALFREYAPAGGLLRKYLADRVAAREKSPLAEQINAFLVFLKFLEDRLVEKGVAAVLDSVYEKYLAAVVGPENRFEFDGITEMAADFGTDLAGFYKQVVLNPNESEYPYKTDRVSCLSFHAAKGLEFAVVFIVGAEEGIVPVSRKDADLEEERRLFYVAMTRAGDRLYISRLERRRLYGRLETRQASRFLQQIPPEICTLVDLGLQDKKEQYLQQMLF